MRRFRVLAISVLTMLSLLLSTLGAAPAAAAASSASNAPLLREIRAAHHPGFDRLVLEFSGPLPRRTQAQW